MSMTIPAWAVPLGLTIMIWSWGILMPLPDARGDYDFGPMFSGIFRGVVCIIGTLLFWLLYFMAKAWV
jgi:hypothetical protein